MLQDFLVWLVGGQVLMFLALTVGTYLWFFALLTIERRITKGKWWWK